MLDWDSFDRWLNSTPIIIVTVFALVAMLAAATIGSVLRERRDTRRAKQDVDLEGDRKGYLVSAVLGLLALLMGFTFALAVDRYEIRRALVLEEANAIGTTYLRAQLLEAPHRARISALLVAYTDNRIALATAAQGEGAALLARNDALLTDLWTATAAAYPTISGAPFSSTFVESMNAVIDMDAARKAARGAHIPTAVLLVLLIYLVVTAGVMGYVLKAEGRGTAAFVLLLLVLSLTLVIDIDRPGRGLVRERQFAMEQLRASLAAQPPEVFDRWRDDGREER